MTQANADPGLNYIRFNISGSCPRIINLNAPLPLIEQIPHLVHCVIVTGAQIVSDQAMRPRIFAASIAH